MRQTAPFPMALDELVDRVKYKDGWTFTLADIDRGQGSEGLTLIIALNVADGYLPARNVRVNHYMIVPPAAYDAREWKRWLFDQILLVEQHEAGEFFQIGDERPYAPHHAPGRNPYVVHEVGTQEDATTDYLGNRFSLQEKLGKA